MIVTHLYFRFPVVSSELDELAQDDDDHIELAWLMRTRQKNVSAPVFRAHQSSNKTKKQLSPSSTEEANSALLRSFHFRVDSNRPIQEKLKIPEHGVEFVGYFIVSLHTRWTELTDSAGGTILNLVHALADVNLWHGSTANIKSCRTNGNSMGVGQMRRSLNAYLSLVHSGSIWTRYLRTTTQNYGSWLTR